MKTLTDPEQRYKRAYEQSMEDDFKERYIHFLEQNIGKSITLHYDGAYQFTQTHRITPEFIEKALDYI